MHYWRSALLACVALCALLALAAFPAGALAAEETSPGDGSVSKAAAQAADMAPAQTATLTIIASRAAPDSSSYDANGATVWVNKDYVIKDGDTVESLLDAAVAEGDLDAVDIHWARTAAGSYRLKSGDSVTWVYTLDYGNDV